MAKQSRSPEAAEIYQTLVEVYAQRAARAMDELMHPTDELAWHPQAGKPEMCQSQEARKAD